MEELYQASPSYIVRKDCGNHLEAAQDILLKAQLAGDTVMLCVSLRAE